MAKTIICADTSILIDYFRKKNKKETPFFHLAVKYVFAISVITKFEILNGSSSDQRLFWERMFECIKIIPLGEHEIEIASHILKKLKSQNKLIDLPDIFIGATALANDLRLATLNVNHFQRIENLELIFPS